MDSVERAEHQGRSTLRIAVVLLVLGLAGFVIFGLYLQRQMAAASAQVSEAQRQAEAARTLAANEIAASRTSAERQVAESKETARRAQIMSDVLVAPDLVRYVLWGGEKAPEARGQLLWSRSRGLVISGSRLPPSPPGFVYQFWLFTNAGPVSGALATPDAQGRFSYVTDTLPTVPRPVTGAALTLEPGRGSATPSGAAVLFYRAP